MLFGHLKSVFSERIPMNHRLYPVFRPAYVIGTPYSERRISKERHRSAAAILRQQLPNARVFSVELQKILDKYKQLWDEPFFGMNFKEYSSLEILYSMLKAAYHLLWLFFPILLLYWRPEIGLLVIV